MSLCSAADVPYDMLYVRCYMLLRLWWVRLLNTASQVWVVFIKGLFTLITWDTMGYGKHAGSTHSIEIKNAKINASKNIPISYPPPPLKRNDL